MILGNKRVLKFLCSKPQKLLRFFKILQLRPLKYQNKVYLKILNEKF